MALAHTDSLNCRLCFPKTHPEHPALTHMHRPLPRHNRNNCRLTRPHLPTPVHRTTMSRRRNNKDSAAKEAKVPASIARHLTYHPSLTLTRMY